MTPEQRWVRSLDYFEQMKGRGCRIIDPDTLQPVTLGARSKTHFVIGDAVGVCEDEKAATKPLDRKPFVALDKIMGLVGAGAADADIVSTLAARLTRLDRQLDPAQRQTIAQHAGGKTLSELNTGLLKSIDPDEVQKRAIEKFQIPAGQEPSERQLQQAEQERMREALKPFHNPKLRGAILDIRGALEQVIDEQTPDVVLRAGFDAGALAKAQALLGNFRQFIEDHKDEIDALKVLYSRPYRAGLRYSQVKDLAAAIQRSPHRLDPERIWQAFETVEPEKVSGHGGKKLVDVIALVRHALDPETQLAPVIQTVEERYHAWLGDQSAAGVQFTSEQRRWLDAIKEHIASSLNIETEDFEQVPFNQIGGLGRAYELFGEGLAGIIEDLNMRLAA